MTTMRVRNDNPDMHSTLRTVTTCSLLLIATASQSDRHTVQAAVREAIRARQLRVEQQAWEREWVYYNANECEKSSTHWQ